MIDKKIVAIATRAALDAGKEIENIYNFSEFEIELKSDNSPLTFADRCANDIINSFLTPTGIPIISEENKQTDFYIRKDWDTCWIVDPLDGTKEFINRNGEFTVNIALIEKGIPVFGVIYAPISKVLYIGDVKGQKSLKVELKSHYTKIDKVLKLATQLTPRNDDSESLVVVGSRSHMNKETSDYIHQLKSSGKNAAIVSKGSSLKFCLIAEGTADIYPRFAPTMEWDTAAGHAICKAVGIDVLSLENNLPLTYNKENLLNPSFICKS